MRILRQQNNANGIVVLSVTLLLAAVIVEISVIGAIIAYALTNANYSVRLASEALSFARAGVADAMMRVARDKNWSSVAPYSVVVGSGSADVVVCKDLKTVAASCDTPNVGKREITSTGKAFTRRQKIRAIIDVDAVTGESRLVEVSEIAS